MGEKPILANDLPSCDEGQSNLPAFSILAPRELIGWFVVPDNQFFRIPQLLRREIPVAHRGFPIAPFLRADRRSKLAR